MSETFRKILEGRVRHHDDDKDRIIAELTRRVQEQASYIQTLEQQLAESASDQGLFLPILKIAEIVTQKTKFPLSELKSDRKDKPAVTVRFIVIYLACRYTRLSTVRIGKFLNRDHTTVRYGRDKLAERLSLEPLLKDLVEEIEREIRLELNREGPELATVNYALQG